MTVANMSDDVKLSVYDEDVTSDDFIGSVFVKMSSFCHGGASGTSEWVTHLTYLLVHHHVRKQTSRSSFD